MAGLRISTNLCAPEGKWILMRDGKVVVIVDSGSPIEDVECDEIILPTADFDEIIAKIPLAKS